MISVPRFKYIFWIDGSYDYGGRNTYIDSKGKVRTYIYIHIVTVEYWAQHQHLQGTSIQNTLPKAIQDVLGGEVTDSMFEYFGSSLKCIQTLTSLGCMYCGVSS
jgi:hypothetical protein